jgi:predicted DNA-binding transcriptional regulator AlpA
VSINSHGLGNDQFPAPGGHDDSEDALDAYLAAQFLGIALVTLWRQVDKGELPLPFYPAPRAPRWRKGELRNACEAKRMLPREAKAVRRAARVATEQAAQLR